MSWTQGQETIEELVRAGHLEKVPPQPQFASEVLIVCDTHIQSAKKLALDDPISSLQTAYDAARKALTSILHAQGLRPTSRGGQIAVAQAITAQMGAGTSIGARFDRLRRARNGNEYPSPETRPTSTEDAEAAIEVAVAAVAAARRLIPEMGPYVPPRRA